MAGLIVSGSIAYFFRKPGVTLFETWKTRGRIYRNLEKYVRPGYVFLVKATAYIGLMFIFASIAVMYVEEFS
jgi:hypothetical protein